MILLYSPKEFFLEKLSLTVLQIFFFFFFYVTGKGNIQGAVIRAVNRAFPLFFVFKYVFIVALSFNRLFLNSVLYVTAFYMFLNILIWKGTDYLWHIFTSNVPIHVLCRRACIDVLCRRILLNSLKVAFQVRLSC